jgi:arginine utilization regulatory protein
MRGDSCMLQDVTDTNELMKAILSTIDEGIHVVDATGITIFYNYVAAKHDGLDINEVLGKHILESFPSLSTETSTLLKVIKSGQPIYNQHQTYHNLRGHLIDTVNTTLPIKVKNELIGAVEIAKDISKVKQLSEKLMDLQVKVAGRTLTKKVKSAHNYNMTDLITKDTQLIKIKEKALKVSQTSSHILIYGETGTGKELLVSAIHNASPRKKSPFIAQNCAAIPASLLESLLFGTAKGSYTGAIDRAGLFELADRGTLFLDELNSMPLEIQAKLLRVLEDGVIRRVGGTREISVNVRIIAALNEPPEQCIKNQLLRKDLYYRLNVVFFKLPLLNERKEDILLLTEHFIQKYNFKFDKLITRVHPSVKSIFLAYDWPGNVRELEHAIESAMNIIEGDTIRIEHLPLHLVEEKQIVTSGEEGVKTSLREAIQETELQLIRSAISKSEGNIQKAAKLLNIPRQTLQYKIKKYELT